MAEGLSGRILAMNTEQRDLLRRLTLNDPIAVAATVSGRSFAQVSRLDAKTDALVRLAGLVALSSETASIHAAVDRAHGAGADDEEILESVIAIAPIVGLSRVSAALPGLAAAIELN
jgi:alkylhydroperoxidase/carboxymuconolactone decarboxylase family protein YurZ